MPFLLDGNPSQSEISDAVNYLLSNFGANLSSDPNTGQITGSGGQVIGYLYKYMMVKYADSFDGTVNFSNTQTNRLYYGLRNDDSSTESTNPADYIWYKVAGGGFSTTKTLYYKVTGGRSIDINIATTSPGYAWVPDTGVAIDLDALTMAFTINAIIYKFGTSTTPARPSTATTYDWVTNTYTAPAGWSTSVPSGGAPGDYLWSISILVTQTGGIQSSPLDWTNVAYPIVAVGIFGQNGQNGNSGLVAYLVQSQASPTPAFTATTTGPNAPSGWSLVTPAVAVGQVLWYIQGQYNSSTTDTINGVPPNTTAWTGPIAASIFQDIRSDNWNGSNPPTAGNPATYGTQGYYIQRSTGSAYLNNLFARGEITVGSSPEISGTTMTGSGTHLYADGRFALGNSSKNITFNGSQATLNGFTNGVAQDLASSTLQDSSGRYTVTTLTFTINQTGTVLVQGDYSAGMSTFTSSLATTYPGASFRIVFALYNSAGTQVGTFSAPFVSAGATRYQYNSTLYASGFNSVITCSKIFTLTADTYTLRTSCDLVTWIDSTGTLIQPSSFTSWLPATDLTINGNSFAYQVLV